MIDPAWIILVAVTTVILVGVLGWRMQSGLRAVRVDLELPSVCSRLGKVMCGNLRVTLTGDDDDAGELIHGPDVAQEARRMRGVSSIARETEVLHPTKKRGRVTRT